MRSLTFKLILVFLVVSLAGTLLAAFLIRQRNEEAFDRFLLDQGAAYFVRDVQAYYTMTGSLDGIERLYYGRPSRGDDRHRPPPMALADTGGQVVMGGGPWQPGQQIPADTLAQGLPVTVDGEQVATVLPLNQELERDVFEQRYLAGIDQALILGALGATAIAVLLGALLAGTLTRPLREVAAASHDVAQGQLGRQVPVRTHDELGELATAFNQMSAELARAVAQRRQMTADIAHDLRTPLTVLSGYLEAMSGGDLAVTAERLDIMQQEVRGLTRLVEDLRTLSLADAGELTLQLQETDVGALLAQVQRAYAPQAVQQQVSLRRQVAPDLPPLQLDPERMRQVLGNLVSNALRHTPAGGTVSLSAARNGAGDLLLGVHDTGSGISEEDLPHIFDRFYRGDKARADGQGESGLGLAIVRSLVEMHQGNVSVSSAPGRGTSFTIHLPT